MSSHHSFDTAIAEEYGIEAAIMYQSIQFWVAKNEANNSHEIDGEHWCYNSRSAWRKLFPYMTDRKIRTAIEKLEAGGLIKTGNHSGGNYGRTTWYTLVKTSKAIGQNDQTITGISTTVISKDNIPPIVPQQACAGKPNYDSDGFSEMVDELDEDDFGLFWVAFPKRAGTNPKPTAKKAYFRARKKVDAATLLRAAEAYAMECGQKDDKQFIPMVSTWLNQERWEDAEPIMKEYICLGTNNRIMLDPEEAKGYGPAIQEVGG